MVEETKTNKFNTKEIDETIRNINKVYETITQYSEDENFHKLFIPRVSDYIKALKMKCINEDDLKELKDAIEIRNVSPMEQLRQRGWICHWSLFVHFTQKDSYDNFLDFFSDRVYIQTMQNICPWLLRYYGVAILLSTKRKNMIRDLLNEIQDLSHLYTDPILSFITTLYDSFDIDLTQIKLKETLLLMKNDFFFMCSYTKIC
jgi:hypothetical protein